MPEVNEKLSTQGLETVASTPRVFGEHMAKEIRKWERVVKAAGIKPE